MTQALEHRRAELAATIEEDYSPARHLALLAGIASATVVLTALGIRHLTWGELAVAPGAFLVSNFGEWALHRYVLHEPTKLRALYQRHAQIHHVMYTHDAFEIRSARELRYVLMPWFSLPAMLLAIGPIVAALALLWSANAARVFVLETVVYYAVYEVLHTLYHLPVTAPVARWAPVQWLRRQHRVHHEPSLMRACNFNVTFPVADGVLGTWRAER